MVCGGLCGTIVMMSFGLILMLLWVVWVNIVSNLSCGSFTQSSLIVAVNDSRVLVTVVSI